MSENKKVVLSFPELPHYLTITATFDYEKDNVTVLCESTIHVNKQNKMPTSFSIGFVEDRPSQFMADVLGYVITKYGLKLAPAKYE